MLTPERPPIADHPIWPKMFPFWNLQRGSKNQRRFPHHPLPDDLDTANVIVPCVCGQEFAPFRGGSMFFTAPEHRSCASTPTARHWALWAKLEIGKVHAEHVQYELYE